MSEHMKRRALLKAGAIASIGSITGCLGSDNDDEPDKPPAEVAKEKAIHGMDQEAHEHWIFEYDVELRKSELFIAATTAAELEKSQWESGWIPIFAYAYGIKHSDAKVDGRGKLIQGKDPGANGDIIATWFCKNEYAKKWGSGEYSDDEFINKVKDYWQWK